MAAPQLNPSLPNDSRTYQLYITLSVTTFALVTATALRLIARLRHGIQKLKWDDYFMVLGTCLNVIATGFDAAAGANGFGRHTQFLTPDQLITARKWSQIAVLTAIIAIWAIKISICFFILRLIKGTHAVFVAVTWSLMAFTTVTSLITCILWGIQAKPIAALWDPRIPGTQVSPDTFVAFSYVFYVFAMVTDLFYALSPIYFLWNIKINQKRKAAILALIGLGVLVAVVAALKIAFANELADPSDPTWTPIKLYICSIIERNVGGFIANLPILRHLMGKVVHFTSSSHRSRHYTLRDDLENLANGRKPRPASQPRSDDTLAANFFDASTINASTIDRDERNSLHSRDFHMASLRPPLSDKVAPEVPRDAHVARRSESDGTLRGWNDPSLEKKSTMTGPGELS